MKTSKLLTAIVIISATVFVSCKKDKKDEPLEKCVAAMIEGVNFLENINPPQISGSTYLDEYRSKPTSISVPTGSMIRVNTAWNFEKYKDSDADVSKILCKIDYSGTVVECEAPKLGTSPWWYIPAYKNGTINLKFILTNGEEQALGPYSFTVNNDSKILKDSDYDSYVTVPNSESRILLASELDSEKEGFRYLFSPNYYNGLQGGFGLYKALLSSSFNSSNDEFFSHFGLFCLSNKNLASNQIKIVASDQIQSNSIYPELIAKYGCGLGIFNARFEPWNVNIDTTIIEPFHSYINTNGLNTYSALDTINLINPQSVLVLSYGQSCFRFITSYGKKGLGRIVFNNNNNKKGYIEFIMQR